MIIEKIARHIKAINDDLCNENGQKELYKDKDEYRDIMENIEEELEDFLNTIRWYLNPEIDEETG